MEGQASMFIAASPETLYAMVSDVTRMGEWSPETWKCEWVDDSRGVGAKFAGHNRLGPLKWTTTPTISVAEPGRAFGFTTGVAHWRYDFEAAEGGTTLTESFNIEFTGFFALFASVSRRRNALMRGITKTIARIKAAAEA